MAKTTITNEKTPSNNKSIKFDMNTDEAVRKSARLGYEVAKVFKEAGITFKRVIPAHADVSTRKLFRLGATGNSLCLEVVIPGKTAEEKQEAIEEIKDQFLMMPAYVLVSDKPYNSGGGSIVHRFLFRPSKMDNE